MATGTFTAIANSGFYSTTVNINSNQLGNASGGLVTYTVASGATLTGISNAGVAATCALSIQNNDIRGIVYSVAGTNIHYYITNSAPALSQNISNNTFTNLSVNTSGAITFISDNVIMPAGGMQNINGNSIVTSFTRTAISGAITLFTSAASTDLPNVTVNNNNNNFSNITINSSATISGWINTDAGVGNVTKTIDGNTFNNWIAGTGAITAMNVNITSPNNATKNNIISNISSAGTITGITTAAGNDSILLNTIQTLVSTGGTTTVVNGIAVTGGTTKQISRNTIYNLQANNITTGSVSGIAISAGLSNTIFRNKIYDISSSNAGITTGTVNGILISGAVVSQVNYHLQQYDRGFARNCCKCSQSNHRDQHFQYRRSIRHQCVLQHNLSECYFHRYKFWFNRHLSCSQRYCHYGDSGLRNNIIVNLSTSQGTGGYTVVYRRSAGTANMLNNYATTSNNNLFYTGTPGALRLIYSDGASSAQTLAAYKAGAFTSGTIAPRDQASVTESPTFISTTGADATFLHINTSTDTQIESGAVNISSITVDFDGDIRQGNTGYTGASTTAP